jgi:hypothetical protein
MTDSFTHEVMRVIIARIAMHMKITAMSESSLDLLTDAVIQNTTRIAAQGRRIAAHGGRTDGNAYDVFTAYQRSRQREDPTTLSRFLQGQSKSSVPPCDFLVKPYPLPRRMAFSDLDASIMRGSPPILPFRSNTTIDYPRTPHHLLIGGQYQPASSDEPWRPWFFPRYPPEFTYRETPSRGGAGEAIEELKAARESDQAAIKKKLGLLLQNRQDDRERTVFLDLKLVAPPARRDMVEVPRKATSHSIGWTPVDENPEFLPAERVVEGASPTAANQKDVKGWLDILAIEHPEGAVGKVEPAGRPEKRGKE